MEPQISATRKGEVKAMVGGTVHGSLVEEIVREWFELLRDGEQCGVQVIDMLEELWAAGEISSASRLESAVRAAVGDAK